MGDVIDFHAQRDARREDPHITVDCNVVGVRRIHVYPLAYFRALIAGEDVEPLPEEMVRAIVHDWLVHSGLGADDE